MADMQTAVEVLARALQGGSAQFFPWDTLSEQARDMFRNQATALLAEIEPLIRADEQEACAKLADAEADMRRTQQQDAKRRNAPKEARDFESMAIAAIYIAAAIRQRGNE